MKLYRVTLRTVGLREHWTTDPHSTVSTVTWEVRGDTHGSALSEALRQAERHASQASYTAPVLDDVLACVAL